METHSGYVRFGLLASALLALLVAMWAGLLRLGWELPWWQPALALSHGPLIVCGFLGTLISLERSVALNRWWAYAAPLSTALGTLHLIVGLPGPYGPLLILLGSLALVGNFAVFFRRHPTLFMGTMGLGAVAWLIGNWLWLSGVPIPSMVHWWSGFLLLTIAGERLELSRFVPTARRSKELFVISLTIYWVGLLFASLDWARGTAVAGVGMLFLALWLARFDVGRYTVHQPGLPRFIAVSFFSGYLWLAVGGLLWIQAGRLLANPDLLPLRYDAMLHTIFLGFVFPMIFAHAPIIFPAITRHPLPFHRSFYSHLVLLHLSLFLRVGSALAGLFTPYRWGVLLSVLAVVLFLANNAYSAWHGLREAKGAAKTTVAITGAG